MLPFTTQNRICTVVGAIVVIPTYNERENIPVLVEQIAKRLPNLHILIVDDNSPDGTGEVADQLALAYPGKCFVMHREKKEGLGKAYTAGFKYVLDKGYDFVLQMDADLSHDPNYIPSMLEKIQTCDLVLGSRYTQGINVVNWDFKRLILSKMASRYVRTILRLPFTDVTGGFKCWRRKALASLDLDRLFSRGYLFLVETTYTAYKKGFRVAEVPIIFFERNLGRSKMDWKVISESLLGVILLRFRRTGRRGTRE